MNRSREERDGDRDRLPPSAPPVSRPDPNGEPAESRAVSWPRPRAIIFDLFHTLIDVNEAPGLGTAQILGLDPLAWNKAVIEEARHHALGQESDPYESIRRIVHDLDSTISEDKIREAVEARPQRFRFGLTHVRPEIIAGVKTIRAMGLRIALLSNAGLDEIEAWPDSPLAPYFDAALFSCHEGLMKPDPAYYERAAARIGVRPAECLFVGDGGSREHEGARRAGMRTVLILGLLERTLPQIAARRPRDTDWVVREMGDLLGIVRRLVDPPSTGD